MTRKRTNILGATFLISGTCVGAGMLGIPAYTGLAGFYPSMAINFLAWLFMCATGMLFLEVTLWMHDGANLLSMSRRFLGRYGQILAAASFFFLYYCLLIGYFSGISPTIISMLKTSTGITIGTNTCFIIVASVLLFMLFLGTRAVDRINFILIVGLIFSFIALITMGRSSVSMDLLFRQQWGFCLLGAPILFAAYGYHNIIPTMSTYLKRDVRALKFAVFFGSLIPFIIYSLWQWLLIGALPREIFIEALEKGVPITEVIDSVFNNSFISNCARYFAFFAIVTSTLGVALSMVDFLGDGFNIKHRRGIKRLFLCLAVIIPPLIFVWHKPDVFNKALHYAGGYGEAILNGFFPIIMVWIGKYYLNLKSNVKLFNSKFVLSLLMLATIFVIILETLHVFKIGGF